MVLRLCGFSLWQQTKNAPHYPIIQKKFLFSPGYAYFFSNEPTSQRGGMSKIKIVTEYFSFLKENKKWLLGPIVIILLLLGLLIVLTGGSALAPFIYTIF